MRLPVKCLLTAVLAGLILSPAFGQLPQLAGLQSMMANGVGKPFLLANEGVKREIRLSGEQDNQVRKVFREVFEKYQPEFRKVQGDREKQTKLVIDSTRETRDRLDKALPTILQPEQLKRLNQIQIQVNGIISFKRPDVLKKLNLSAGQLIEIGKIGLSLKTDTNKILQDASTAPLRRMPGALRKVKEMKDAATQKAIEKLTSEQKQAWQELTGEKFDLRFELPMRRGIRP